MATDGGPWRAAGAFGPRPGADLTSRALTRAPCDALKWPYQTPRRCRSNAKFEDPPHYGRARDRHLPGPQFRHAEDRDRRWASTASGDATLNGRELAVRELSRRSRHPLPDRPRRPPDRGHLAVPLPRRLLAARPGHHDAPSPRSTWRCGTSRPRSPACRCTNCWAARAATACVVYGHANGADHRGDHRPKPDVIATMGYTAIRLQSGVPGLASTYGVSRDKMFYEPADGALPSENVWSTRKVPALGARRCSRRRARRWGGTSHLLHDVHHRLTPIEAARLGKDLEPYRLFWLEDAVPAENQANFRLIRQHTTTPLAVGEVFNTIWDCKQLIEEQLIDYIRATVVHAGGITPSAPHRDPGRSLQCAHRLSRRDRSVAGLHGGGAAFRPVDSQFRHPGIHAPHARRPTRSSRMPTPSMTGFAASRRCAGPGRGYR